MLILTLAMGAGVVVGQPELAYANGAFHCDLNPQCKNGNPGTEGQGRDSGVGVIGKSKFKRKIREKQNYRRKDGAQVRSRSVTKVLKSGDIQQKEFFVISSKEGVRQAYSLILRNEKGQIVAMERAKYWTYANGTTFDYRYSYRSEGGDSGYYLLEFMGEKVKVEHPAYISVIVGEEFLD
jgi:hypothetical protein